MNKKIFIGLAIIILLAAMIFIIIHFISFSSELPLNFPTENYDIHRDYCGKVIDYHYCQCAFEGESCEVLNIDKETADRLVRAGFEGWLTKKKEEACIQKHGHWKDGKCK